MGLTLTKGHQKLIRILENEFGLEVEVEKSFPPFYGDVFIPELGIIVEFDGPIHKLTKKRDIERDRILRDEYGINRIVRITEGDFADTKRIEEKVFSKTPS